MLLQKGVWLTLAEPIDQIANFSIQQGLETGCTGSTKDKNQQITAYAISRLPDKREKTGGQGLVQIFGGIGIYQPFKPSKH